MVRRDKSDSPRPSSPTGVRGEKGVAASEKVTDLPLDLPVGPNHAAQVACQAGTFFEDCTTGRLARRVDSTQVLIEPGNRIGAVFEAIVMACQEVDFRQAQGHRRSQAAAGFDALDEPQVFAKIGEGLRLDLAGVGWIQEEQEPVAFQGPASAIIGGVHFGRHFARVVENVQQDVRSAEGDRGRGS